MCLGGNSAKLWKQIKIHFKANMIFWREPKKHDGWLILTTFYRKILMKKKNNQQKVKISLIVSFVAKVSAKNSDLSILIDYVGWMRKSLQCSWTTMTDAIGQSQIGNLTIEKMLNESGLLQIIAKTLNFKCAIFQLATVKCAFKGSLCIFTKPLQI